MKELYLVVQAKGDDWLRVADIVFPMFGPRGDGCMFSNKEEHRVYLNGNHAFVVRVYAALKNNGYTPVISYEDIT